ncbi:unnamed protein product [Heterobilharzia americana]|nr:unnamed protein product [Heterobilharzia americana]
MNFHSEMLSFHDFLTRSENRLLKTSVDQNTYTEFSPNVTDTEEFTEYGFGPYDNEFNQYLLNFGDEAGTSLFIIFSNKQQLNIVLIPIFLFSLFSS